MNHNTQIHPCPCEDGLLFIHHRMGNTFFYGLLTFVALFLIALVLKLCTVLTWSWWWIASPLWVPASIILILFLIDALMLYITIRRR